jgi:hypothetical protein
MTTTEVKQTEPLHNKVRFTTILRGQNVTVETGVRVLPGSWLLAVTFWMTDGKELNIALSREELTAVCQEAAKANRETSHHRQMH